MKIYDHLQFKKLDLAGLQTLVDFAIEEGWNPGPYDAEVYFQTDPHGFYGYFLEDELIGGGSIVSYGGKFGFMGFFIVKPEYRSQGIGRKLWYQRRDTLLARLQEGAPIGMDGVVPMQEFYKNGGFELAYKDLRFEREGGSFDIHPNISSIEADDLSSILNLDERCFGYSRPQFLHPWLNLPESSSFKFVEDGRLMGFAMTRKIHVGYKVCPLFAENEVVAESLYQACLNAAGAEPLYIDIPEINQKALSMVNKYKAKYVFECGRMYYGTPPEIALDKVYGVTTFELG